MARSLNRATLIGNLGADPELRTVGAGTRVAKLSVATGRSWTDADGNPHERTEWHRVVLWGARAEWAERYLRKGERVYVEGEIQYRSYEDGEGVTRFSTDINAREILLLGGRDHAAPAQPPASAPRAPGRGTAGAGVAPAVGTRSAAFDEDDLPF